ncbi:MAG TPA: YciI family protein [Methylibium sp.]|uniref:YciI family protein n=1 Tax=Methylibium sp. TaxID=2067992 RepID=UPI002DB85E3D|nr:YciI family protein [Methylibium sp.]HEU4459832.1 YciI family protein [Methylibium sp.]
MAYMLMILEPREQRGERSLDEGKLLYQRMLDWGDELRARGIFKASESLRPDADAVRVQVREGRRVLVDGPFTEAKEMVGGFYLLDCKTRDEAIALAAECPAAQWCSVEVREVAPCYIA